tara:strand:- start:10622 stop:12238 length:1617 start_codon:yes stop_codon:yes gene_type:complete
MNRIRLVLIAITVLITASASAQSVYSVNSPFNSIRQNGVSNIAALGDTVWISPSLNRNIGNQLDWYFPANAVKVIEDVGRVFSLALSKDTVVAGLGYSSEILDGTVPASFGYYFSDDGGDNWRYSDFLIDPKASDDCKTSVAGCDTTFVYGGETYDRIRITVPEQSPPYDIDFKGNVVFSANWASGLLRSTDFGATWERVILPPVSVRELTPNGNNYYWASCIEGDSQTNSCIESINLYDSVDDNNLKGFGVEIDSQNRVWYGSANGINVSDDAISSPTDSISWKHVNFDDSDDGLLSNWIIEIEEDPATNKVWMTNWISNAQAGEKFGIVSTADNGETFEQHLIGEKINSIGFKDGAVIAAGPNGLFISTNDGQSWSQFPQIKSANTFFKKSVEFLSVASTTDRIWIGTDDGLASSDDLGQTWEITRVDFPLSGGNIHDPEAKSVKTYAYPNPFSPVAHEFVRIKYELKKQGNVRIRVFDFGMNLVREVENDNFSPGTYEAIWDGVDAYGRQAANGTYIYTVEMPNQTVNGKILLIE